MHRRKDMSNDDVFITRSTINAKETIEIDGVTYPLVKVEISIKEFEAMMKEQGVSTLEI